MATNAFPRDPCDGESRNLVGPPLRKLTLRGRAGAQGKLENANCGKSDGTSERDIEIAMRGAGKTVHGRAFLRDEII